MSFIKDFLQQGDIFLDIGSNIGLFSLIAANRLRKKGFVHAFEPVQTTFQRLCENISLNHLTNVKCHRTALSDAEGVLKMAVSLDGYDAWNSAARPYMGKFFSSEEVPAKTLDNWISENPSIGGISLAKIDVEGWEYRVLNGGRKLFSGPDAPTLLVEFTDDAAANAGSSCSALYDKLEEYGYRLYSYNHLARVLLPAPRQEKYPYVNLIACKRPEETTRRLKA